jgi:hypothetical protein
LLVSTNNDTQKYHKINKSSSSISSSLGFLFSLLSLLQVCCLVFVLATYGKGSIGFVMRKMKKKYC